MAPLKTLITGGRLNFTHLQPAKTLTAIQAACVLCRSILGKIHLAGRCDRFLGTLHEIRDAWTRTEFKITELLGDYY